MSATTAAAEIIYDMTDRWLYAMFVKDSLIPALALVSCLVMIIALAIQQRKAKDQVEKQTSTRFDRLRIQTLVLVAFATCIMLYTTLSIGSLLRKQSSRDIYPDKDRPVKIPDLYNATIRELQHGLESHQYTSVDLVDAYLARINEVNPLLHAVIETAPLELLYKEAKKFDEERMNNVYRGYLHGIPILVKDNIATDVALGMNTTAGSFALLHSVPPGDSIIVASLRKAGAIVLGKTNMSVWAQGRGNTTQGWSPRGNFTFSAFYPNGNACSSSSGAGVATSIGLSAVSIGTETDGSIICPSSRNNHVGFKPSVGFSSRFGIIPISSTQDTAGPMTKSVEDAAIILTSMFTPKNSFQSNLDKAVKLQPRRIARGIDYAKRLIDLHLEDQDYPLADVRIGFVRGEMLDSEVNGFDEEVVEIYEKALSQLELAGATLINVNLDYNDEAVSDDRVSIMAAEFHESINTYLSYLEYIPSGIFNMGGIIDFAIQNSDVELPEGQDQTFLIQTLYSPMYEPIKIGQDAKTRKLNETYVAALQRGQQSHEELLKVMKENKVIALVGPSDSLLHSLAAKAGSPSISIPAGFLRSKGVEPIQGNRPVWPFNGAPVGLNFISTRWQEESLLRVARGYEVWQTRKQQCSHDGKIRTYKEATPTTQLSDIISRRL